MVNRLRLVLVAPRIAANVGNAFRSAEALGAELSLVGPLGFHLTDKYLKRTSVGYWDDDQVKLYRDADHYWGEVEFNASTQFIFATKRGQVVYSEVHYAQDVVVLFGNEEEGIPEVFFDPKKLILQGIQPVVVACRIPMVGVRCLNLATSVGVMGFEIARQWNWAGFDREFK